VFRKPGSAIRSKGQEAYSHTVLFPVFYENLLDKAGFPRTTHNMISVVERVSVMAEGQIRHWLTQVGTKKDIAWFDAVSKPSEEESPLDLPDEMMTEVGILFPQLADNLRRLPSRIEDALLQSKTNEGGYFYGDPEKPLPMFSQWSESE
jgi:hypothetical protein